MPGPYEIGTVRHMTLLDGLSNPVDGYMISFTWTDANGKGRNGNIEIEQRSANEAAVRAAIEAEIGKIESWLS